MCRLAELGLVMAVVSSCAGVRVEPPRLGQLKADWRVYGHDYVQQDGRVIDQTRGGITTSEGQAYGLLRAVWVDDRQAFDLLRTWTLHNLQGSDATRLPAWKWGAKEDGSWGVIDPQPASDADILIAYAMLAGALNWGDEELRGQAHGLLTRIWDEEVRDVGPYKVLLPGPWATGYDPIPLNPSYWATFAYRAFAEHDAHPWGELIEPAYTLLEHGFDRYNLPPDWLHVDATTGEIIDPPADSPHPTDFGFEALRLPWLLLADARWHDELRAKLLVARFEVLGKRFREEGMVPAIIGSDGSSRVEWESRSLYGALLPSWAETRPEDVPPLLARIDALAVPSPRSREQGRDYYADNWVWFGKALWARLPPPLKVR
jgi:endo-1,4-beta-D-glucanase Y